MLTPLSIEFFCILWSALQNKIWLQWTLPENRNSAVVQTTLKKTQNEAGVKGGRFEEGKHDRWQTSFLKVDVLPGNLITSNCWLRLSLSHCQSLHQLPRPWHRRSDIENVQQSRKTRKILVRITSSWIGIFANSFDTVAYIVDLHSKPLIEGLLLKAFAQVKIFKVLFFKQFGGLVERGLLMR